VAWETLHNIVLFTCVNPISAYVSLALLGRCPPLVLIAEIFFIAICGLLAELVEEALLALLSMLLFSAQSSSMLGTLAYMCAVAGLVILTYLCYGRPVKAIDGGHAWKTQLHCDDSMPLMPLSPFPPTNSVWDTKINRFDI